MHARMRLFYYVIFSVFIVVSVVHAADPSASWYQLNSAKQSSISRVQIPMEVFLTSSCAHCKALSTFLEQYEKTHTWITVHRYYIDIDKHALEKLNHLTQSQRIVLNQFATPAVFFCDSRWLGFDTAEHLGKELAHGLSFCKQMILKDGRLSQETIQKLRGWGNSTMFNPPFYDYFHGIFYPIMLVFLDSISSGVFCVWVIVAFLMLAQDRKISCLWTGGLVAITTLVHFCQQMQIAFFLNIPGVLTWLALGVGVWLMLFVWRSSKPFMHHAQSSVFLGLSAITVIMIMLFQGQPMPNFSIVFEQHLQTKNTSVVGYWAALGFYQIIYSMLLCLYIYLLWGISNLFKTYPKYVQFFYKGILVYSALYLSLATFF